MRKKEARSVLVPSGGTQRISTLPPHLLQPTYIALVRRRFVDRRVGVLYMQQLGFRQKRAANAYLRNPCQMGKICGKGKTKLRGVGWGSRGKGYGDLMLH